MEAKAEDVTAGPGTRYEHVHSGGLKCIHRQERKPSAGRSGLREGLRRLPRNRNAGAKGSIIDEGHVSVRSPGARDDVRSMAALAGRSSEALLFFLLFVSRGLIQHLSRDLCL